MRYLLARATETSSKWAMAGLAAWLLAHGAPPDVIAGVAAVVQWAVPAILAAIIATPERGE